MNPADSYLSADLPGAHAFLVLMYYAGASLRMLRVEANSYADAVMLAAPGNDVVKVEVLGV